jgi:hypothetical protein
MFATFDRRTYDAHQNRNEYPQPPRDSRSQTLNLLETPEKLPKSVLKDGSRPENRVEMVGREGTLASGGSTYWCGLTVC